MCSQLHIILHIIWLHIMCNRDSTLCAANITAAHNVQQAAHNVQPVHIMCCDWNASVASLEDNEKGIGSV